MLAVPTQAQVDAVNYLCILYIQYLYVKSTVFVGSGSDCFLVKIMFEMNKQCLKNLTSTDLLSA
jgi:hypothetical protein